MDQTKKKVAIFHCGFIYSGGGERIVLEEARNLLQRGWQVEVYAPTLNIDKCYPDLIKKIQVKTFFPSVVNKLPLRNALRMITSSFLAPILAVNFRDTDIFIGANQPGAWIAYIVANILKKPYIVYQNQPNRILFPRPVDREFGWYTTEKDYYFLYHLLRRMRPVMLLLDKASVIGGSALLANGSYIGSILENIYGKKVVNCPAGSYIQPQKKLKKTAEVFTGILHLIKHKIPKPYILITNRHDPQKRFDYVIYALAEINKNHSVKLVIPGPFTDYTSKLIKLVKKLHLEDKVFFLGQISEVDLQKLYQYAAVYCYPSPEEDYGLGPLEAAGWGVPTVAWDHAGPTVTIDHGTTGFLAKPYHLKSYTKYILELLNNTALREQMGKSARDRTKNLFSWKKHMDILEKELRQALIKPTYGKD